MRTRAAERSLSPLEESYTWKPSGHAPRRNANYNGTRRASAPRSSALLVRTSAVVCTGTVVSFPVRGSFFCAERTLAVKPEVKLHELLYFTT